MNFESQTLVLVQITDSDLRSFPSHFFQTSRSNIPLHTFLILRHNYIFKAADKALVLILESTILGFYAKNVLFFLLCCYIAIFDFLFKTFLF